MATLTSVCPACQETVPSGRLSCSSCGLLLASVAGASPRRRSRKSTTVAEAPIAAIPSQPAAVGAYVPPDANASSRLMLPARAWAGITSASPRPMAGLGMAAHPMPIAGAGAGAGGMVSTTSGSLLVKVPTAPPARTAMPQAADGHATDGDSATDETELAGWLEAAAGWLMIIGSAVAILGFLLPWSNTVIGAEGAGTYFDTWGIANPSHVMVVLALAAALGLAIVANPIPTWLRTCAVGLALGGVLVGLTWPYLFGPLGGGPGVLAILVGGIMLGAAGVLDLVEARHASAEPLV